MSKKIKWLLVLVLVMGVWAAGVFYLYRSYSSEGVVQVGIGVKAINKEFRVDPKTGALVEVKKSFLESKLPELLILTLMCGSMALFTIVRAIKSRSEEAEQDTEFATLKLKN